MEVIEKFTANSRGWSKERHNIKRVVVIEENEENNLAKEIAALRVRMDKIDRRLSCHWRRQLCSNSGGPNRTYSNYRPNQGVI
ncbi:hypothetical protein AAHA92_06141 [Salvia divinorum]|uniref:Uncharacterized protein n=1 Tax=Salvia divinorum TaxID=28513 RepID=A0ABD1I7W4_SALDI